MYLLEDIRKNWKNYSKCHICGSVYLNWDGLSKHVDQQYKNNPNGPHPSLEEYKGLYFPPGYLEGISPNDRCLYVFCDPEFPGEFDYNNVNLFGEDISLLFHYKPIYVGFGKMGIAGRYRRSTGKDCNESLHEKWKELKEKHLGFIIYVIVENLTTKQGKEGEKILVPLIGRQNHPDPSCQGFLLNKNSGGDGYESGELSKKSRDKMSKSRKGNKNRCDTWRLTRIVDGYVVETNDLRKTCEELGLDIKCIHQIAAGKQKSHRGWYAENLTKRKAVGGNY